MNYRLFFTDFLKPYGKEDVAVKIIVTLTRNFPTLKSMGKSSTTLKTYEKDLFIIQNDLLVREIPN